MFVGIDIGGTNIKGALVNKSGKLLGFQKTETPASSEEIDKTIYSIIENLATSATVSKIDISAICIGAAGSIDRVKGVVITSPNIPSWKEYPLTKNIEKITGTKTFLENDATVACAGAWWQGKGTRYRNWIMVTLGTGIGGAAVIDNKIYTGQNGSSMEIGHMTIEFNGRKCVCGNQGCLEQYASATALVGFIRENINKFPESSIHEIIKREPLTAKIIYEEAIKKDPLAVNAIKDISGYLGIGVANLVNIFNPEAILFGGGLSQAGKIIIPIVKKTVKQRALPGLKENIKYLTLKDQSKIAAMGAAKLAIDRYNEAK
ncbi:MAG: ROK family protein [Spirochaetota bacterium]